MEKPIKFGLILSFVILISDFVIWGFLMMNNILNLGDIGDVISGILFSLGLLTLLPGSILIPESIFCTKRVDIVGCFGDKIFLTIVIITSIIIWFCIGAIIGKISKKTH